MTFSAGSGKTSYAGDGSTTSFPTTFKFTLGSHVKAIVRDANGIETTWVEATDYTLTGAGNDAGGTLTATVAPASGETLVIILDVPFTQEKAFPLGGSFPSTQVEEMGDLNSMQSAKLSEVDNRTLKVPETDTQVGSNLDIPIDSVRAGKFLAFDTNGKPIVAAGTSADLGPVSSFINDLLDDGDAPTARGTLDAQKDLLKILTADSDLVVRLAGAVTRLAIGANGRVLRAVTGAPAWAELINSLIEETTVDLAADDIVFYDDSAALDRKIPVRDFLSTSLDLQTEQASTSGTEIDFADIPATAKRITIMFDGVSTDSTAVPEIQLGDSGGFETSGYNGSCGHVDGTETATLLSSQTGFIIGDVWASGATLYGTMVLTLMDATNNAWAAHGVMGKGNVARVMAMGGTKALSGTLTQIRIASKLGNFDAGSINILVE